MHVVHVSCVRLCFVFFFVPIFMPKSFSIYVAYMCDELAIICSYMHSKVSQYYYAAFQYLPFVSPTTIDKPYITAFPKM